MKDSAELRVERGYLIGVKRPDLQCIRRSSVRGLYRKVSGNVSVDIIVLCLCTSSVTPIAPREPRCAPSMRAPPPSAGAVAPASAGTQVTRRGDRPGGVQLSAAERATEFSVRSRDACGCCGHPPLVGCPRPRYALSLHCRHARRVNRASHFLLQRVHARTAVLATARARALLLGALANRAGVATTALKVASLHVDTRTEPR